jgi:hypothetical protein
MAKGGKRPGAGRPKGSVTKPQLRTYFDKKEIAALVIQLKERAKTDSTILKFIGEQIFGKPAQTFDLPEDGEVGVIVGFTFTRNENNKAGNPANG